MPAAKARRSLHVLLRHRLVLQPHGFEGLGWVFEHFHPLLPAVADRPNLGEGHIAGYASHLRSAALADERDDPFARIMQRLNFDLPVLPGVVPVLDEAPRRLDALVDLLVNYAAELRHVPNEVRRDDLCGEVARGLEVLVTAMNDLHVLLGHRLLLHTYGFEGLSFCPELTGERD